MHLSLTTPRGALVDAEVDEVTAPGALGEFGVLPGHVPFLSVLKPGVLVYRTKDGPRYLAVAGGVLEVARAAADKADKVLVLVEQAAHARELDREAAAKELAAAEHELAHWKKETNTGEYQALLARRAWAAARVDAAARITPH
jgi:F-type H+-transporting ATPase subunit epsilon